ncbi:MAG: zinc-dependent alcohol dehydrogenase [Thermomicrobiales bacterium]
MPRELVAISPRTPVLREYEDGQLGPREIRVRTEFASPKHVTELVGYRNDPAANRPYDPNRGAAFPRPADEGLKGFPRRLGNMAVGTITDIGPDVSRFAVGDRVYGHFPIRETQTCDETAADLMPAGMTDAAAVCLDPAVMAFAIRDAGIKLGDRVAVFGLGAIGLMSVQFARLAGATEIIGVDFIENRRALATVYGATAVVDPREVGGDAGWAIRDMTGLGGERPVWEPGPQVLGGYREDLTQVGERGVDVAVETSGSTRALHDAIRASRFGGTICLISYYGGEAAGLYLGDEFHVNRLNLISCRAQSLPMRDYPAWTLQRYATTCAEWLRTGQLRSDGIITPVVSLDDAAEAYREIDEHPERSIKLGVAFGG